MFHKRASYASLNHEVAFVVFPCSSCFKMKIGYHDEVGYKIPENRCRVRISKLQVQEIGNPQQKSFNIGPSFLARLFKLYRRVFVFAVHGTNFDRRLFCLDHDPRL